MAQKSNIQWTDAKLIPLYLVPLEKIMGTTSEGRISQFCRENNISIAYYNKQVGKGLKWCTGCKDWHIISEFGTDKTRYDGLTAMCLEARKKVYKKGYKPKPRPEKGRVFVVARDGDEKQARRRINYLVEAGIIPHPNKVSCTDCGHVWVEGERRHEYDHYNGYNSKSHYLVESVCSVCHKKRTNIKK